MSLLIDGYNLLHATDLFGEGALAGTLQGSREALLRFLASRLTEAERRRTTIVFDAAGAPPGLPAHATLEGISVRYARGYPDADTLLEELIESWPAPKGLTVVSSDHRVQRAARGRGASYIDSDAWHAGIRRRRPVASPQESDKADPGAAAFWIEKFADEELLDQVEKQDAALRRHPPAAPRESSSSNNGRKGRGGKKRQPGPHGVGDADADGFGGGLLNPFPPGYAEDIDEDFRDESDDESRGKSSDGAGMDRDQP